MAAAQSGIAAARDLPECPEMALQCRGCESGDIELAPPQHANKTKRAIFPCRMGAFSRINRAKCKRDG
jgi:hypothetical protein